MNQRKEKVEWDKKKIILFVAGIILLVIIVLIFRKMMLGGEVTTPTSTNAVKGVTTQSLPSLPEVKQTIQNQLNNLKNEAQNINVVDVATSSPQVQKVINDLKAIQDYPKTQLRQTCEKICSGL